VTSTVSQLNIKPRVPGEFGLPKGPVDSLRVGPAGAEGDYNRYRTETLHGDPDQALLVVTEDLLRTLASEGWPVRPGDLGENLTVAGLAEAALAPRVRLRVGDAVIEITIPCDPCTELYSLPYVGAERGPAFLRATAGRRGWYARVLVPATILPGAAVTIIPPDRSA
jgi:MOSC domain-containing protein YiiM